jgi:hypothetical protein
MYEDRPPKGPGPRIEVFPLRCPNHPASGAPSLLWGNGGGLVRCIRCDGLIAIFIGLIHAAPSLRIQTVLLKNRIGASLIRLACPSHPCLGEVDVSYAPPRIVVRCSTCWTRLACLRGDLVVPKAALNWRTGQ